MIRKPAGAEGVRGWKAADQSSVRTSNLGLVLREAFNGGGGLSRAEIAARTGLTRATVSRLIRDALEADLLVESTPDDGVRMGRPSTPLYPAPKTCVGIGLEVNVDHFAGIAVDLAGNRISQFVVEDDFADSDAADVLSRLAEASQIMVEELRGLGVKEIIAVSVAVPGVVDRVSSEVVYAPNLGWKHFSVSSALTGSFPPGIPLEVHNDADLQAISAEIDVVEDSELSPTFLYVSGDTGIGGALVFDGELFGGEKGWTGEIGHTTVDPTGSLCHCGSRGCLETYAGWRAIAKASHMDWTEGVESLQRRLSDDDPVAVSAVNRAGWALGIAIANVVKLLDIRSVVLGTGLGALCPWLLPEIQRQLDEGLLASNSADISVVAAPFQKYPAARGGAYVALRKKLEYPEKRGALIL